MCALRDSLNGSGAPAHESRSREPEAKQRERGGFGNDCRSSRGYRSGERVIDDSKLFYRTGYRELSARDIEFCDVYVELNFHELHRIEEFHKS